MQKNVKILLGAVFCLISLPSLHCAVPPQNAAWRIIHVIPVVNQPEESYDDRGNLSLRDRWYVLLGQNANRGAGKIPNNSEWDVLTASQSEMQPTTIFGFATIKSLPWQRSKQFFMKTIYNTLELLTGTARIIGKKGLYTRSDYDYYYQDEPIPPYFVDSKNAELYVFLKLSNKKNSTFLEADNTWTSQWKKQFVWAPVDELTKMANGRNSILSKSGQDYYVNSFVRDLFRTTDNERKSVISQWQTAFTQLNEYERNLTSKSKKPVIQKQKQDIEEEYARHAKDSWLLFANALYFSEDTKEYKVFALNDETYPIDFGDGQTYASLGAYRDHVTYEAKDFPARQRTQAIIDAVYEGLEKKVTEHPELQTLLLNTADKVLIYGNRKEPLFGIGSVGHGENYLGRMLMVLRANLRAPTDKKKMIFTPEKAFPLDRLQVQFNQVNPAQGMLRYLRYRATGGLPVVGSAASKYSAKQQESVKPGYKEIKKNTGAEELERTELSSKFFGRPEGEIVFPKEQSAKRTPQQKTQSARTSPVQRQQPTELKTPTGQPSGIRRRMVKKTPDEEKLAAIEQKKREMMKQVDEPKEQ